MAFLADIALANLIVAVMLALLAGMAGLWGKRPALTHALWLLVLLKLITPPLFDCAIPWPATPVRADQEPVAQTKPLPEARELPVKAQEPAAADLVLPFEEQAPSQDVLEPRADAVGVPANRPAFAQPIAPVQMPPALPVRAPVNAAPVDAREPIEESAHASIWSNLALFAWLAGAGFWLTLALHRLWRFHRWLRFAQPAPAFAQELARGLAGRLQVRCPEVCVIPGNVSPMLWTLGHAPRLLLPAGLLERLSADQLTTLLAHELAHWRRRDDRVRWLELAVLALYWWCPLVWWARRELNQAEEECCDAWVVSILPDSAKAYALALLETVDFLSGAPALPVLASGLGHVRLLKRRLTMILQGKTPRALTVTGLLGVAGVGLLLLPLVFSWAPGVQATAQPDEKKSDRKKGKKERPADPRDQLEKIRMDVERLEEEVQMRQQELQKHMEQLQQAMERLRQLDRARQGNRLPGGRPPGGGDAPPGGIPGPGVIPGGPPGVIPGGPGWPGGQPGPKDPRGAGGFPGGGGVGGQPPFGQANLEQRLNQVERKLDTLLQELRGLRNDMKKGTKGPMGGGRPGDPNNPPPPPRNPPIRNFIPDEPPGSVGATGERRP